MRLRRLTVLAAALPLLLVTAPAAQADRPDTVPGRAQAERALDRAQAVFNERASARGRSGSNAVERADARSATLLLRDLIAARPRLSGRDREVADALLARPTDADGGGFGERYSVPEATPVCGTVVCIHYVTSTVDAPPLTDADRNGIPDAVSRALETAEKVHGDYVAAGYRRPVGDGSIGGGTNLVDIYLSDLGAQGLYGYCTSDQPFDPNSPDYTQWAYCSVDDDFSAAQFGSARTPTENLQVTIAHEYFHAVQFAYDTFEDGWLMEATATWAEDEIPEYDGINDNRQYLRAGHLVRPGLPLDMFNGSIGNHYGNWIFFRYLTERYTAEQGGMPTAVREVWEKVSADPGEQDMYSLQAVISALKARGTTLPAFLAAFADANRRPGRSYEEGSAYPVAAPRKTWRLSNGTRGTGWRYTTQKHLTSAAIRFTPGRGTTQRNWALRLNLDLIPTSNGSSARVTTYRKDGSVTSSAVTLRSDGNATRTVGFSSGSVKYVELVYTNASARTTCWVSAIYDPHYSCFGDPTIDNARQRYRATAFRR